MATFGNKKIETPRGGGAERFFKFPDLDKNESPKRIRVVHPEFIQYDCLKWVDVPKRVADHGGMRVVIGHYEPNPSNPDEDVYVETIPHSELNKVVDCNGKPLTTYEIQTRWRCIVWDYSEGKAKWADKASDFVPKINDYAMSDDWGDPREYDFNVGTKKVKKFPEVQLEPVPPKPLKSDIKSVLDEEVAAVKEEWELTIYSSIEELAEAIGGSVVGSSAGDIFDDDGEEDPF